MDFLQIKDSKPLTEWEERCVEQLKSLFVPGDTYEVKTIEDYDSVTESVNASDSLRFEWLSTHKNGIYIDNDCFLKERLVPPENGKCCFPKSNKEKSIDYFLIYVNGNTDYIKENFNPEIRKKYLEENVLEKNRKNFYGWPIGLLRALTDLNHIPETIYEHKYQSMNGELKRRGIMRDVREVAVSMVEVLDKLKVDIYNLRDAVVEFALKSEALENELKELKEKVEVKE